MFKVAALAVVKDEAAYIVDWINHCFYMGFEEVYIAVNRSSDLTEKILFDFSALDNRVHVYNTDWLDMFPNRDGINIHLQYYSFCFLLNEASKKEDITHFFPLDADEFWFSDVFGQSIGEYLSSLPSFDVVSIPWAAQSGDSMEFLMPFENSLFLGHMKIHQDIVNQIPGPGYNRKFKKHRAHFYFLLEIHGFGHFLA